MNALHPKFIVGVGGSAGALKAYKAFLNALSVETDMAFIIISHMNPTAYSQLAHILSRHTKMPVIIASQKMPIQRNHVYVIAADSDLSIENFTFNVASPRSGRAVAIDIFFSSLAEGLGARAIGIVLSGYASDGTQGCKHIKAKGGITFAQDKSAEVPDMPVNAQASGCVDFVLPPDQIATELNKIGKP